jgi:sec-independent protein translocase protein TatA
MSWVQWLLLAGVLLLMFGGGGKISGFMGDVGKGISRFKKNLKGKDD